LKILMYLIERVVLNLLTLCAEDNTG